MPRRKSIPFGWKAITIGLSKTNDTGLQHLFSERKVHTAIEEGRRKKIIGRTQVVQRGFGTWEGVEEPSITIFAEAGRKGIEYLRKKAEQQQAVAVESRQSRDKGFYLYSQGGDVTTAQPQSEKSAYKIKGQYVFVINIYTGDIGKARRILQQTSSATGYHIFSGANLRQTGPGHFQITTATVYDSAYNITASAVEKAISDFRNNGIHATAKVVRVA